MQRLSSLFIIFLAAFATLLSTSRVHAQTPTVVLEDLESLTVASNDLQITCSEITIVNVVFAGPRLALALGRIVRSIVQVTFQITVVDPRPFNDDLAGQVVEFVEIHQNLLSTIIGKHGLLAQFKLTGPVRAVLVTLEAAIDSLIKALIELIPTRRTACDQAKAKLDASIKSCITTYS